MRQVLLQGCLDLPTGILHNKQVSNHIILFPHVSYAFQDHDDRSFFILWQVDGGQSWLIELGWTCDLWCVQR